MVRSLPRASAGLSRFAASPEPAAPPAPMRVCASSMNRTMGFSEHLLDHLPQAVLELALHARARLQQAEVQRAEGDVLERRRHVAGHDALGEPLHHRRLAHAGLAGEDGVVLTPAHDDVDDLADLVVASADRVELVVAGARGEVDGEPLQGLLLAHRRGRHGAARLARGHAAAGRRGQGVLRRTADDLDEVVGQVVHLNLRELPRDRVEHVPQRRGLRQRHQQVSRAHAAVVQHEGAVHPRPLHRLLQVRREVGDRGGAAGETVERRRHLRGQAREVRAELLEDAVEVGILELGDLVEPVHELDVGVAPQLAERGGALDRSVGQAVELPEHCRATDFCHGSISFPSDRGAARGGRPVL